MNELDSIHINGDKTSLKKHKFEKPNVGAKKSGSLLSLNVVTLSKFRKTGDLTPEIIKKSVSESHVGQMDNIIVKTTETFTNSVSVGLTTIEAPIEESVETAIESNEEEQNESQNDVENAKPVTEEEITGDKTMPVTTNATDESIVKEEDSSLDDKTKL